MKTDARIRYTQMVIKNSFIQLLKEKPLAKVTVKEICSLAEINRATFYKYYCDPYDLLDKLEQEFLAELQDSIQGSVQENIKDTITLIMVNIKANSEMYQALFSENGDPHFPGRIFATCYQYTAINNNKRFQRFSPAERSWIYYFIAQGCSGILNQWIEQGMKEPVNEVAGFADRLIQNAIRSL